MPAPFDKTYEVKIAESFPKFAYPKSFQRIQALLDSPDLVKPLLKQLDKEVADLFTKNKKEEGYTIAFAMYDTLRAVEKANGFSPDQVKYLLGVLKAEEFIAMVKQKCAFMDPYVTLKHGAETHRIQWWMIAQDIKKNAGLYEPKVNAGTLFEAALSPEGFKSAADNVWYHNLDAVQGKCTTARAPEYLKEHFMTKGLYPAISEAEQASMVWDNTVKMGYAKWKSLAGPARIMEKNFEVKTLGKR